MRSPSRRRAGPGPSPGKWAAWTSLCAAALVAGACRPDAAPHPGASRPPPREIPVYFLADRDGQLHLASEARTLRDDHRIAVAAVEELLEGPRAEGLFSPFPRGTRVVSVDVDRGVATVDWTAEVLTASVGAEAEVYGIQSVAYTLAGIPGIEKVRFTVEGKASGTASNGRAIEDWWGHTGLTGQPFAPDPAMRVFDASGE